MNKRLSAIQNVSIGTLLFELTGDRIVEDHENGQVTIIREGEHFNYERKMTLSEMLEYMAEVAKSGETVIESAIN